MNQQITLRDIYMGKPDASDEIIVDGFDSFLNSFIMPNNFDANMMMQNTQCFITGYKGTGKTALLYYLDNFFHKENNSSVTMFIRFKQDYNEVKRSRMESQAKRIISVINIDTNVDTDNQDFEYIWTWELFKKIIEANGINKGKLFVSDENWKNFKKIIQKIEKDTNIYKYVIAPRFSFDVESTQSGSFSAGIKAEEVERKSAYQQFVDLVDEAYELFRLVERTKVPFYIFMDELEAYYGNDTIFKRDLRLIRDLIFTIKKINLVFWKDGNRNSKIISALRTEIRNAINNFIISKEVNKVLGGFEYILKWNYHNTNSIEHPIMKILLRRIQMAELRIGNNFDESTVFHKWFPDNQIYDENVISYILNNTWNKPRDIVRLLTVISNDISGGKSAFSIDVFEKIKKDYSIESLREIREEMLSLYSVENIEDIFSVLKGFRVTFTLDELKIRIMREFSKSIFADSIETALNNLYRLGIIGNYSEMSKSYHWQHRDDEGPLFTEEWQLRIHRALWDAFSINKRHDRAAKLMKRKGDEYKGQIVPIKVIGIPDSNYAIVEFQINNQDLSGLIFKDGVSTSFVNDINDYLYVGFETEAMIIRYDVSHDNWILKKNF